MYIVSFESYNPNRGRGEADISVETFKEMIELYRSLKSGDYFNDEDERLIGIEVYKEVFPEVINISHEMDLSKYIEILDRENLEQCWEALALLHTNESIEETILGMLDIILKLERKLNNK